MRTVSAVGEIINAWQLYNAEFVCGVCMQLCHNYMLWLYGAGTVLEAPERRGANDRAVMT